MMLLLLRKIIPCLLKVLYSWSVNFCEITFPVSLWNYCLWSKIEFKLSFQESYRNDPFQSIMRSVRNIFSVCFSNKLSWKCSWSCCLAWDTSAKCCLLYHWSKWVGSSFESKIVAYSTLHPQAKHHSYYNSNKRPNMGYKYFSLPSQFTSVRMWMRPGHVRKC